MRMTLLPTGTVTFLFTDIEGSTKLAREYTDNWQTILARHNTILQSAITAHKGHVFRKIGDEFNAAFETARDALSAALSAQHALNAENWGEIGSMRVRMAMHTGPATLRAGEYEGYLTLSRAKRLMSVAYGGQILLSEAAEALLRDPLPTDIALLDLGEHRLKDFERGEHIYQVVAPDLPTEFPPIKSLKQFQNNLPAQLSSFIGRSSEMSDIKQLLSQERLLTLTGPSGSGKTRLALQVAADMIDQFPDGVFFVALAPITDAGLVASSIAQTLSLTETPGLSIMDSLKAYLRSKSLLLVLDNFEQVIFAAPLVADLLVACTELKILVTSREGLRIRGEHEYPVLPLALPNLTKLPPLESLTKYTAVELFIERAQAVKPDFRITDDTASAVAEICYRLDGLPLAIELAAARVKILPPQAMLARLEHRLEFLTGGARDMPARQQTLRNAIAWSYDLLNEGERILFRRLSIFVGGFTVNAAEAVAGDDQIHVSVLDGLGSLLDKSLLREGESIAGEPRFMMLETLREFGLEELSASGGEDMISHRHANYFLNLAEQTEAGLESADQVQWINRMELEHDNLRAALDWSIKADNTAEICLRLGGTLGIFWEARGYISEGRERLAAILSTAGALGPTAARARLLSRAAELAYRQSDYPATTSYAGECLEICRLIGDKHGMAAALIKLGNSSTEVGDYASASEYLEEALMIWRDLEDKHGIARALISLSWAALRPGDLPLAKRRLMEALALSRELGDTRHIGFELSGLGEIAMREGDYVQATKFVEESLALRRQLGNKWGVGVSLGILGWIGIQEGDWNKAIERLSESLAIRREIGDLSGSAWCLEHFAEVAHAQGQAEKAVRLFAAGSALRESISSVIDPVDRSEYEGKIKSLRLELGDNRFMAEWVEGHSLTLEQATAHAVES